MTANTKSASQAERTAAMLGAVMMLAAPPAFAMGYDSLACPELRDRRIEYFNTNGFCAPGEKPEAQAKKAGQDCQEAPEGVKSLPEAERNQVEMIVKVEARKGCPAQ